MLRIMYCLLLIELIIFTNASAISRIVLCTSLRISAIPRIVLYTYSVYRLFRELFCVLYYFLAIKKFLITVPFLPMTC